MVKDKITKDDVLKILEIEYDKGSIETINKIMKDSKKDNALDTAITIIDNINTILEDFTKKYKFLTN